MDLWSVVEIFATIIQSFMCTWFLHKFLERRLSKKANIIVYFMATILFTLFVSLVNTVTFFEGIAVLIFPLLLFVYSAFFLSGKLINKIIASIIPILSTAIISSVLFNVVSAIFEVPVYNVLALPGVPRLIFLICFQFALYSILTVILRIFNKNAITLSKAESFLIVTVFLISITLIALLSVVILETHLSKMIHFSLFTCILGLVIINMATIYLVERLSQNHQLITQNKLLQQRIDFQEQYTEIARQQHQSTLRLQHDLKHNLSVLSVLIGSNELDKAKELLGEYMEENTHNVVLINTTNESLNAIISLKLTYAHSLGIKTFCVVPETFNLLSEVEVCSLFGNMLDNAIEYCQKHLNKENEISVTIVSENMKTIIIVKNRLHNSVLDTNVGLETDKNNKENHGFGLKSITQIVKKNNGVYDFYEKDNTFYAKVLLFEDDPKGIISY